MEDLPEQPIQTDRARDVDFREIKPTKSKPNLVLVIGGLLVLIAIGVGIYLFLNSNKNSSNSTAKKSETKTATTSAKQNSGSCPGKTEVVNQKQGYTSCYPAGWVEKELKISGLTVGLDPKQVDDKFPGTITVEISDKSEAQTTQDISDNTSKFAFGPVRIDGIKGTQVTYTRLKTDTLTAFPSAITSVVTNFGRTYTITLNSTESEFAANEIIYNSFIEDFKFIKDTKNPPWTESRNILINSPWLDSSISSPVEISGEATAFEGTVNIRIKDSASHVLAETTAQAASGNERSAFKISVTFASPQTKKGTIEVFTLSAKDGSEQDKVTIPVVFP